MPSKPSVVAVSALVPVALVLPVTSRPSTPPHPVSPTIVEQVVEGVDPDAAAAERGKPRPVALTGRRPAAAYSALGVTWAHDPQVRGVQVQVRTRRDHRWSDWQELEGGTAPDTGTAEGAGVHRDGTDPLWVGAADGVQVRVDAPGSKPRQVRVALIDPGRSAADGQIGRPATLGGATATAAEPQPAYVTRAQWGADESLRSCAPRYTSTIKAAVVHNTATSNTYTAADSPAIVRSSYAYHTQTRGWCDLGYQFMVDKFGTLFEGRAGGVDKPVFGAHTGGFNSYTFGVSSIGNHDLVAPTDATMRTISKVIAWKFGMYGLDPKGTVALTSAGGSDTTWPQGAVVQANVISGHRDYSTKSCPGNLGYPMLGGLRATVADRMADPTTLTLSAGRPAVTYGDTVTLTGRLTTASSTATALGGQTVSLYVRARGSTTWVLQTRATTTADGTWTATHRPTANDEYSARYTGQNARYLADTSNTVTVDVRPAVTAALSRTSVPKGTTLTLTGTVTPAHTGQSVYRQAYVDGAWQTWATTTLSSTGTYTFTIKTSVARTHTYRVLKKADAGHATSTSPTMTLKVY